MKTPNFDELTRRIEQVVQDHIAECRKAAQEALERAFSVATGVSLPGGATGGKGAPSPTRERKPGRRRNLAEVAALGDKVHAAVCANPGETIGTLASRLGASSQDLQRPMALLKRAGKVRQVGERRLTRYFPLESKSA